MKMHGRLWRARGARRKTQQRNIIAPGFDRLIGDRFFKGEPVQLCIVI